MVESDSCSSTSTTAMALAPTSSATVEATRTSAPIPNSPTAVGGVASSVNPDSMSEDGARHADLAVVAVGVQDEHGAARGVPPVTESGMSDAPTSSALARAEQKRLQALERREALARGDRALPTLFQSTASTASMVTTDTSSRSRRHSGAIGCAAAVATATSTLRCCEVGISADGLRA